MKLFYEEEPEESDDLNNLADHLWNADLNCEHNIISPIGGGIKCTKCGGWCCL